jgi:hypothetical protein
MRFQFFVILHRRDTENVLHTNPKNKFCLFCSYIRSDTVIII